MLFEQRAAPISMCPFLPTQSKKHASQIGQFFQEGLKCLKQENMWTHDL